MYTYEGNEPHSLAKVFMDDGSLCCERCGACVCDHAPVGNAKPIWELEWTMTTVQTVGLKPGYEKAQWASGCFNDLEDRGASPKDRFEPNHTHND